MLYSYSTFTPVITTQLLIIHFKTINNNGYNLQIGTAQGYAQRRDGGNEALLRSGEINGNERDGAALLHDQRTQYGVQRGREGGDRLTDLRDETGDVGRQDRAIGRVRQLPYYFRQRGDKGGEGVQCDENPSSEVYVCSG